jgi:protein O-mannosyl-transferase
MSAAQKIRESGADPGVPLPRVALSDQPAANWRLLAIVLTATFIAYARTLSFAFVYDDPLQIVNNPLIHAWRYVPRYFTEDVWGGVNRGVPGNYYRPVFLLWCRLNDALFGSHASLWHLTTVGAHLLVCVLVYYLTLRLVRDRLTAGIAALIFGLHPIHIEGVAWISGVTEPLLGIFFIGAFLAYLRARERGSRGGRWLVLSLFLYVLGMLEKETSLMLPVVIGVYEWLYGEVPGEGSTWKGRLQRGLRAARPTAPFVLLWVPYLMARVAALKGFSHPPSASLSIASVLYTWPSLIWFWIRHLIAPFGLTSVYDMDIVGHPTVLNFLLPGAAVLATCAGLAWGARRSREVAFAAAWLILPLLPVLDIRIFSPYDFVHDRYLYLPSVGLVILIALALRRMHFGKVILFGYPAGQIATALLVAIPLGLGTAYQTWYFKNNGTFYQYNYLMAPDNPLIKSNFATYLGEHGKYAESAKLLESVLPELSDWYVNYNLGHDYYELNRLPEAVIFLSRAVSIDPNKPGPYLGLGLAWLRLKDFDRAEAAFRKAIELQPDGYGFHFALGMVLKERGQSAAALEQFKLELAINPDDEAAKRQIAELSERPTATAH